MLKKILIIEDEPDIVKIAVFRMKQAGYEVFIAADGKKGLELVYYHNPDLVLLDLNLPVMSGTDVCKKIKQTDKLKDIPVIFSTCLDQCEGDNDENTALITKPYEVDDLMEKIEQFI